MSPIDYTIFSRADGAGPSANSYYVGNFMAMAILGGFLSSAGIIVFFIVKPTWEMYQRRVAFVKSLERQEEAKAEARVNAGV